MFIAPLPNCNLQQSLKKSIRICKPVYTNYIQMFDINHGFPVLFLIAFMPVAPFPSPFKKTIALITAHEDVREYGEGDWYSDYINYTQIIDSASDSELHEGRGAENMIGDWAFNDNFFRKIIT